MESLNLLLVQCYSYSYDEERATTVRRELRRLVSSDEGHQFGTLDPKKPSLTTLNPVTVCGECHKKVKKNAQSCGECSSDQVTSPLDYGAITDGLCIAYLWRSADETLSDTRVFLRELVKKLPVARSYVPTPVRMGSEHFRLQCYFATHVLFANSDYGIIPLKRQLFTAEFSFIVGAMSHNFTVRLEGSKETGDIEVVCEFVWALKLLQYSPEHDPELEPLVSEALEFILSREKTLGTTQRGESEYDKALKRYHRFIVAAHALSSYDHFAPRREGKYPLPRMANFL